MRKCNEEALRVYLPGRSNPKVVALGGGHGLSNMLRGMKNYTKNITAIVSVCDDGGGSGMLRKDLGMLPPGDIRNCILALSNAEPAMAQLFDYRFQEGSLTGQSFGNLFLAALNGMSQTFDEAVKQAGEILSITGKVLPVSNQNILLEAEFENGEKIVGESKIFQAKKEHDCRIRQVRLIPEHPTALPESLEAILAADLIVLGPGSLYTSIIPNLLVHGVIDALQRSKALKVLVLNLMTQDGETEDYSAADHLKALMAHGAQGLVDICLANSAPIAPEFVDAYQAEGACQIITKLGTFEAFGAKTVLAPLMHCEQYVRHDSDALARTLLELLYQYKS